MLTDMTLKPQLCAFATILLTWGFPVDAAVVSMLIILPGTRIVTVDVCRCSGRQVIATSSHPLAAFNLQQPYPLPVPSAGMPLGALAFSLVLLKPCCRVPAALFTPCPRCRHGGHFNHLQLWFQDCETCPVPNCNCRCPDETYMLPDTLGIDVP
jgi:hypothetical protein